MTLPDTMFGIQLTGHGGPDVLHARRDIPVPTPGPGEVLIRVAAAGVNNTDVNTRLAWYSKGDADSDDASWSGNPLQFPCIQGADVCGRIAAVGEGVSAERIGERVLIEPCLREGGGQRLDPPWYFGSECDGGFAEYTTVAARHAYRVDSELSDIELASFPCSYSIAITGAEKAEMLRELGADEVVLRDDVLWDAIEASSVDVVVDLVAGEQWPQYLEVLRRQGRYAVSGAIAGPIVELDVRTLYLKDLSLLGCTVLEPEVFANLVAHIEQGCIAPLVAASLPLEQMGEAQALFQEKRHVGKIVLEVGAAG